MTLINFITHKIQKLISDKRFSEILAGSIWTLIARVASTGLGLLSTVIIARFYGAEVIGILALINSFLLLTTTVTVLGTGTSILRMIPEHLIKYSPTSAFKIHQKTQLIVIGTSLIASSMLLLFSDIIAIKVFNKPKMSFYISLSSPFIIFYSLMVINTQAIRGLRLIKAFFIMQFLPQLINLILLISIGFLWTNKDIPIFALLGGFTVTGIIGWIVIIYSFQMKMKPNDNVKAIPGFKILAISLPMLMTSSMTFIIGQTGVIMLGMFRSEAEVGYYSIAVKLATLTSFVLNAVNSMAGPKFSELFHSKKNDELFYVVKRSAQLVFWTTVPILISLAILGQIILSTVFGCEFVVAYPALLILIIGQFVHSISGPTGLFMNMTGNQNIFRNIVFVATIANISANFVLIPEFGIHGAAIAAMISMMGWNVATLAYIKRKYGKTTGYFPKLN